MKKFKPDSDKQNSANDKKIVVTEDNNPKPTKHFLIFIGIMVVLTLIGVGLTLHYQNKKAQATKAEINKSLIKKSNQRYTTYVYKVPSTNPQIDDSQATSHHKYNEHIDFPEDENVLGYSIEKFSQVNKKGINFLFLFKPNTKGAKLQARVLDKFTAQGNNDQYTVQTLNIDEEGITQKQFSSFMLQSIGRAFSSLPNINDIYVIAMKDGYVYDFVMKTDRDISGMNLKNLNNILANLKNVKTKTNTK